MENPNNKVVYMRTASTKEPSGEFETSGAGQGAASAKTGWLGTGAAFLSLLLVIVLFFALQQQISSVVDELKNLSGMRSQVSDMHQRVRVLEDKIPLLDAVPAMAKRTMVRSMLKDAEQRLAFLAREAETEAQSAKFKQAAELLSQIEADLKE
jgi:hypothetical protein